MNPKKKSRRCRGLGLDSGLDLAISRFIYSFDYKYWYTVASKALGWGIKTLSTTARKYRFSLLFTLYGDLRQFRVFQHVAFCLV
jgi:hypothetical protein